MSGWGDGPPMRAPTHMVELRDENDEVQRLLGPMDKARAERMKQRLTGEANLVIRESTAEERKGTGWEEPQ